MKASHSNSLLLVWRIAEVEARHSNAATIQPTHLLLGLCKVVDLDLPMLVPKSDPDRDGILEELLREVRRLREVFRAAGLEARAFRRRLRHMSAGDRLSPSEAERLRRSAAAKRVFADAEHFATIAGRVVYPAHLLYAVLLADDDRRDGLFKELNVDLKRVQQVAKREVLFQCERGAMHADKTKRKLN